MSAIALASFEEEAGTELSLVSKQLGGGAGNGGFARASHALQPENALAAGVVHPFAYLVEKFGSSVGMTLCIVLFGMGVECELGEDEFLANVEDFRQMTLV